MEEFICAVDTSLVQIGKPTILARAISRRIE